MDKEKAYDHIKWNLLFNLLVRIGFKEREFLVSMLSLYKFLFYLSEWLSNQFLQKLSWFVIESTINITFLSFSWKFSAKQVLWIAALFLIYQWGIATMAHLIFHISYLQMIPSVFLGQTNVTFKLPEHFLYALKFSNLRVNLANSSVRNN